MFRVRRAAIPLFCLGVFAVAGFGGPAGAQMMAYGYGAPAPSSAERFVVDTEVANLQVGDMATIAVMQQNPESGCGSTVYVFPRDHPKWLYETGRLLVAYKERARLRISFICRNGEQTINAIQFLTPPAALARSMPTRSEGALAAPVSDRSLAARNARAAGLRSIPLP